MEMISELRSIEIAVKNLRRAYETQTLEDMAIAAWVLSDRVQSIRGAIGREIATKEKV